MTRRKMLDYKERVQINPGSESIGVVNTSWGRHRGPGATDARGGIVRRWRRRRLLGGRVRIEKEKWINWVPPMPDASEQEGVSFNLACALP
jgi:hypothetical protein